MTVNRKRLEFACNAFLTQMTRQFFKLNPEAQESPVKSLMDYPENERSALMRSVAAAIKATQPDDDAAYQTWLSQQQSA